MDAPRIQYARTSDGVNIAYWTLGEGIPLVQTPPIPFSQVQLASNMPEDRRWGDFMWGNIKLVRYDARGTGLSDRDVTDFSPDAFVSDLEAVVDQAKLDRVALWAFITSGPPAIAYAARHPERVSHLILWSTWANTADVLRLPQAQGLLALVDTDWALFTEAAAHSFFGWSAGELAHRAALHLREGINQETWKAMLQALADSDVTELLPQVQAPTLVLHSREAPLPDIGVARELASRIPNARLVVLEGTAAGWEVPGEAITAIRDFLGIATPSASAMPLASSPSGTAVILFADIADSTRLTEQLGDSAFREKARELDGALRSAIREHAGTAIEGKLLGDGVLAVFTSAREAIECALSCRSAGDGVGLALHLGLHAGDVLREEGNVFGGAVNLASRIADASAPGEVLVSDIVRGLARTSAGVAFDDRGEHELKGIAEAQRLWAVREGGA
jgi:class 3 adenylate cyclase/pimeloyl-ACP methyl ester carboxylesterase